jgi:uncharacterized membrane protein YciS (DUF1049 family)
LSALPVIEYIIGIYVFGFIDLVMNDIINVSRYSYYQITDGTIVQSQLGSTDMLAVWFWHGIVVAYIIIGAFWLWRKYTTQQYQSGW